MLLFFYKIQNLIQMKKQQLQAITLIYRQEGNQYEVNPEAIQFLRTIQGKLAIISVAGLYRTGKSYLLNTVILKQKKGFQVGSTINPKTKGIWIWGPIEHINEKNENIKIIVLDSQGIGSTDSDVQHDLKIFSMTLLLSSMFIYNTLGSIDQNAIDSLGVVLRLCEHLKSENYSDFPDLYWVLRDFSLQLVGNEFHPLTPNKYLQNSLNIQTGDSQNRNKIRQIIKSSFANRQCFTFIRPLTNESQLQILDTLDLQQLRPQFIEQVNEFRKLLYSNIKVKKIKGKLLTSELLVELIGAYVSQINGSNLPSVQTGWKNICLQETKNFIKKQFQNIQKRLKNNEFKSMNELVKQFEIFYQFYKKKCIYKDQIQAGLQILIKKFTNCSLLFYKNFKTQKSSISTKISGLQKKIQTLMKQNQEKESLITNLEIQNEKLKQRIQQNASNQNEQNDYAMINLKKNLIEAQQQIKQAECNRLMQVNNFKNNILLKDNELEYIRQQKSHLNEKINQLNKQLTSQRQKRTNKYMDLQKSINSLTSQMQNKHRKALRSLQQEIKQLHQLKQSLEDQLSRVQNDCQIRISKMEEQLQGQKKAHNQRCQNLYQFQLSKKEKELLQLNSRKQSLQASLVKKDLQIQNLKKHMNSQIQNGIKKISQLQAKNQRLNEQYIQLKMDSQNQIPLLKQKNQFLNIKMQNLQKDYNQLKQKYGKLQDEKNAKIQLLQKNIASLNEKIKNQFRANSNQN